MCQLEQLWRKKRITVDNTSYQFDRPIRLRLVYINTVTNSLSITPAKGDYEPLAGYDLPLQFIRDSVGKNCGDRSIENNLSIPHRLWLFWRQMGIGK